MSHTIPKKLSRLFFPCFLLICCLSFFACSNGSADNPSQGAQSNTSCEHAYEIVSTIEATCTAEGNNTFKCDKCSHTYYEVIPLAGHRFGDWQILTKPTCEKVGERERTCEVCNITEHESLEKISHSWTPATCQGPETCTACGETRGESLQHQFVSGICTECGQTNFSSDEEIAAALKACARYPKYIEFNKDLIANEYELFCATGNYKYYTDAHEHMLEICDYLRKVIGHMEGITHIDYFLISIPEDCQELLLDIPTAPISLNTSSARSYIRECKYFAEKADRIFVVFEQLAARYGAS